MGRGSKKRVRSGVFASRAIESFSAFPMSGSLLGVLPDRESFWGIIRDNEIFLEDVDSEDPVFAKYYFSVLRDLEKEAEVFQKEAFFVGREEKVREAFRQDFIHQMTFGEEYGTGAWLFGTSLAKEAASYYKMAITAAPKTKKLAQWILDTLPALMPAWKEEGSFDPEAFEYAFSLSLDKDTNLFTRLARIGSFMIYSRDMPEDFYYNGDYVPQTLMEEVVTRNFLQDLSEKKIARDVDSFSAKALVDAVTHQLTTVGLGNTNSIMIPDSLERLDDKTMDEIIYNFKSIFALEKREKEFENLTQENLASLGEEKILRVLRQTAEHLIADYEANRKTKEKVLVSKILERNIAFALGGDALERLGV